MINEGKSNRKLQNQKGGICWSYAEIKTLFIPKHQSEKSKAPILRTLFVYFFGYILPLRPKLWIFIKANHIKSFVHAYFVRWYHNARCSDYLIIFVNVNTFLELNSCFLYDLFVFSMFFDSCAYWSQFSFHMPVLLPLKALTLLLMYLLTIPQAEYLCVPVLLCTIWHKVCSSQKGWNASNCILTLRWIHAFKVWTKFWEIRFWVTFWNSSTK